MLKRINFGLIVLLFCIVSGSCKKDSDVVDTSDSYLSISFDSNDLSAIKTNSSGEIHYQIGSTKDDVVIEVYSSDDYNVELVRSESLTGVIKIKVGSILKDDNYVNVLVHNGTSALMRILRFKDGVFSLDASNSRIVSADGGTIHFDFFSGIQNTISVPDNAKNWINEESQLSLAILKNGVGGKTRYSSIRISGKDNPNLFVTYTIVQDAGPAWQENEVPPEDEIWYVTTDGSVCNLLNEFDYGCPIVSNTYTDKGVLKCSKAITHIEDNRGYTSSLDPEEGNKVTALLVPDSLEGIGPYSLLFFNLRYFRVPKSLKYVSESFNSKLSSFSGYHISEDGHLLILDGVVCASALNGTVSYSFPKDIRIIGTGSCANLLTVESIELPEGIMRIERDAFANSQSLKGEIKIPDSLDEMGYRAFAECYNIDGFYGNHKFTTDDHRCLLDNDGFIISFAGRDLEEYIIPEGIRGIQEYGMLGAVKLKKLSLPESIINIGGHAFISGRNDGHDCLELEFFEGNHVTSDSRGVIINECLCYVAPKCPPDYVIPEGITGINNECFLCHDRLRTLVCNDAITSIGSYAFASCTNLEKVILPSKLQSFSGYDPFSGDYSLKTIYFRSFLPPIFSNRAQDVFQGYENATIYVPEETVGLYKKMGWSVYYQNIVGYKYNDIGAWNPDVYISSDFTHDGEILTMQTSTIGKGINIVLMGDGFSDRQIADGTYEQAMQKTINAFFVEEPYKSFREYFNVYCVNVVSTLEGYEYSGRALETEFGGGVFVSGNKQKILDYAKQIIPDQSMDDALIIVVMNKDTYAGTCYMYECPGGNYGRGLTITYFPLNSNSDTFNGIVSHEAGGHGFAKLADEYSTASTGAENGAVPLSAVYCAKTGDKHGWYKNIDFTSDPKEVKWSKFISDARYSKEGIGCYEGAYTYSTGVWRPTKNSIMRENSDGFNAPSRYAIWYRINKLAYGEQWEGTYDDFVTYDAVNRTPAALARREAAFHKIMIERPLPHLAQPVVVNHSWRDD